MEGIVILIALLCLALFAGAILSFVNRVNLSSLQKEVDKLASELKQQKIANIELSIAFKKFTSAQAHANTNNDLASESHNRTQDDTSTLANASKDESKNIPQKVRPSNRQTPTKKSKTEFSLDTFLAGNSLLWLGGTVLALGGVFLAKYSIEAGLLPPSVRIVLGSLFGLALIASAEYILRSPKKFNIQSPTISAALASGGLITCYAMALVAFDFYAFLPATLAFIILAIIAIAATWASLRYGPILAAIGVLGAYAVPALVSTGSNNVTALLIYVIAISLSTVWVHHLVKQSWIWWLGLIGHFLWYGLSVFIAVDKGLDANLLDQYAYIQIITLFGLASIYLFTLFPILGWRLQHSVKAALSTKLMLMPRKEQLGVVLPLAGVIFYALALPYQNELVVVFLAYALLMIVIPWRHSAFDTWPFILLVFALFVFTLMPVNFDADNQHTSNLFAFEGRYLFVQLVAFFLVGYAFISQRVLIGRNGFSLLLVSAPLILFGVAYAIADNEYIHYLYPVFSLELTLLAIASSVLALKSQNNMHKLSYLLLANGAIALVFTMLLSASTLTLALAIQIALMAWLSKQYDITLPNWLYKLAIIGVGIRLTLAPWLPQYSGEFLLGLHWSIVIYPLVFGVLLLARRQLANDDLKAWFEGALMHLLALFVTTETSFLLTGSYPNFSQLTFQESVLLAMNYTILAVVYLYRASLSSHPSLYKAFALLLTAGSAHMHVHASILNNPLLSTQNVGSYVIANWLFLQWLVPAIIIFFAIRFTSLASQLHKVAWGLIGLLVILFITGNIRLFFVENISYLDTDISQAELYTYSIVYLVLSVVIIVVSQQREQPQLNKLGFAVLSVVVLKAFVIDMQNLEGLYRALSFIGLGLSIVGIGWLFQRFKKAPDVQHDP